MMEKQLAIRIDKKTYQLIEKVAEKNQRKFSDMTRIILKENLKKYE